MHNHVNAPPTAKAALVSPPIAQNLAAALAEAGSHAWLHSKRFSLWGDADFGLAMAKFLLEVGVEPIHILCHHANKRWKKAVDKILEESPYGKNFKDYIGCGICAP